MFEAKSLYRLIFRFLTATDGRWYTLLTSSLQLAPFCRYLAGVSVNAEDIRHYCLQLPGAGESFPFGNDTLVFKVNGKIFLLLSLDSTPLQFNVKCDPAEAELLRERHAAVKPGYHMNKKHWNTVICDGSVPKKLILEWIQNSYDLVSRKKVRRKS